MSITDKVFSSKPKQIAQAAIQVLIKVFGELENLNLVVISDMKLSLNIAENLKGCGFKSYNLVDKSIEDFIKKYEENDLKEEKLSDFFKKYDMILIGYKSESKLIDELLVRKILKKRKQKPIFFIDCGIPGNININISNIGNCYLFDLNDLEQLYSSWIQNKTPNNESDSEFYDFELKKILDNFFIKLNLNLEQKMIFEKRMDVLLKSKENEIKISLKKFLKTF